MQLERLQNALVAGTDLPVLTASENLDLQSEVANSALSEFDKTEILTYGRYFGRGFGVDLAL